MPLVDCGSVDLSSGAAKAVDLNKFSAIGSDPCEVKLQNESPLTVQVNIGNDQHTLGAWTVDKFALCGKTAFQLVPSQIQSPAPGPVPSNLVLVTVAPEGESIPGTFPAPLSRLINTQQPQANLGQLVVAANGSTSSTFVVPAGTHSIGLLVIGSATAMNVSGVQTGGAYLNLPPAGQSTTLQGYLASPELSANDTQITVFASSLVGCVVVVCALMDPQAVFVFNNPSQALSVGLVGVTGQSLGDTGAAALAPDQVVESCLPVPTSGGIIEGALASFKAAASSVIALVGSLGAFAVGSASTITPAFGQATVAGHLLVAWVGGDPAANDITTASAGWVKDQTLGVAVGAHIFYKPNCANGEAAPTFTIAAPGTGLMFAQLAEFSGAATAAPLDQNLLSNVASTTLQNPAPDVAFGDLVLLATRWNVGAQLATFTDIYNNRAQAVQAGSSGAVSRTQHSSFSYAIVPAAALPLPLGTAQFDYDVQGSNAPAVGSQAKVILAAAAGKTYRCNLATASMAQGAATAGTSAAIVLDGATTIYQDDMGVDTVAGHFAQAGRSGLALKGTVGNSMTMQTGAGIAGVGMTVVVGAYLR